MLIDKAIVRLGLLEYCVLGHNTLLSHVCVGTYLLGCQNQQCWNLLIIVSVNATTHTHLFAKLIINK